MANSKCEFDSAGTPPGRRVRSRFNPPGSLPELHLCSAPLDGRPEQARVIASFKRIVIYVL